MFHNSLICCLRMEETAVLHEDVLFPQVNIIVLGDACDEFMARMFVRRRNIYQ